jgi:hypothetical protein
MLVHCVGCWTDDESMTDESHSPEGTEFHEKRSVAFSEYNAIRSSSFV